MKLHKLLLPLTLLALAATACTDEETELGLGLTDPATLYNGKCDTLYADRAWTVRDDSLATSGLSFLAVGNYSDATFGSVSSELFMQVKLPSINADIDLSRYTIDSVVLSFHKYELYPDTAGSYRFHFEVAQTAEAIAGDSTYYASQSVPVEATPLFDGMVSVAQGDTIVSLRLTDALDNTLLTPATADEFSAALRGLRLRIVPTDSDPGMLTINFAAVRTCLTVHYSFEELHSSIVLDVGNTATHFIHVSHDYAGTVFAAADTVDGTTLLYAEPLAGQKLGLSFDSALRDFAARHSFPVIHHAELQLTRVGAADAMPPLRLMGTYVTPDGRELYVNDLRDAYTYAGYDGNFDDTRNGYRMRLTQHVQTLLRQGYDGGTSFFIDARRSDARRTVLGGAQHPTDRARLVLVYSESE